MLGSVASRPALPDDVLTLDAARALAVAGNPDLHAAHHRLVRAAAQIEEAKSRFFPVISMTHTGRRTFQTPASLNRLNVALQPVPQVPTDIQSDNVVLTTLLSALRMPFLGSSSPVGDRNSFGEHSTAVTASWTLFDGFIREARLRAAKYLRRASLMSDADTQRLIIHAVDTAYYQIQLAEEQVRIAKADEAFSQEQFEETETIRVAGRATVSDVNNFKVRVLAARARVTASLGLRETGRVALAELMGLSDVTMPDALALMPLADETDEEMSSPDPAPWIACALRNRPDLRELEWFLRSTKADVLAAKGLYSPTVQLSGSWGFDRSSTLRYTKEDQSSALGLEVRWDLFTGGNRRSLIRQASSAHQEAAALVRRKRLAVQSDVRQSVIDVRDDQEQIRLQRQKLETARESRRAVQAAYIAGKQTLTRLNETQRDFLTAEADLALARIRLRQAWSDLSAAAAHNEQDGPLPAGP